MSDQATFSFELPVQGTAPVSRHTSRKGAVHAAGQALSQAMRIYELIPSTPGVVSDHDLAAWTGLPLTTVCARVGSLRLRGWIVRDGVKLGPRGVPNSTWRRMTDDERQLMRARQRDLTASA